MSDTGSGKTIWPEERMGPSGEAQGGGSQPPDKFEVAWKHYDMGNAGGWEKVAFTSGYGAGFKDGMEVVKLAAASPETAAQPPAKEGRRKILDDLARAEVEQGTYDLVPDDFHAEAAQPMSERELFEKWAESTGEYVSIVNGKSVQQWLDDDFPIWLAGWQAARAGMGEQKRHWLPSYVDMTPLQALEHATDMYEGLTETYGTQSDRDAVQMLKMLATSLRPETGRLAEAILAEQKLLDDDNCQDLDSHYSCYTESMKRLTKLAGEALTGAGEKKS